MTLDDWLEDLYELRKVRDGFHAELADLLVRHSNLYWGSKKRGWLKSKNILELERKMQKKIDRKRNIIHAIEEDIAELEIEWFKTFERGRQILADRQRYADYMENKKQNVDGGQHGNQL